MKITLETRGTPVSFQTTAGERILHAGLTQGISLPYECATGTCGQCRAKLCSGEVEELWPEAPGNALIKRDKGEILTCQAAAQEECTLSILHTLTPLPNRPSLMQGVISELTPLARDVIRLKISLSQPMTFLAGQFAVLSIGAVRGPRAYSLACSGPAGILEFLVKRKPNGHMTQWLFETARTGSPIDVFGPLGNAVYREDQDEELLLISGSSGLSSSLSILRTGMKNGHLRQHQAYVFFGVRTAADLFYVDELAEIARNEPNVTVTICLSDEPSSQLRQDNIRFASGFVHETVRGHLVNRPQNTTAFLAGPPPMVDATIRVLMSECKIPATKIRYDKFS